MKIVQHVSFIVSLLQLLTLPFQTKAQQIIALSDLVTTKAANFRLVAEQHKVYFDLTFTNAGFGVAALPVAIVRSELSRDSSLGQDEGVGTQNITVNENLAMGQSRTLNSVYFDYGAKVLANYTYAVISVNGGVALQETNYENNKLIVNFRQKPDLIFDDSSIRRLGDGNFSFKIKNIGAKSNPLHGMGVGSSNTKLTFYTSAGDPSQTEIVNIPTPPIDGLGFTQLQVTVPKACLNHDCAVKIKVDSNNNINEFIENNNETTIRMGGQ